MALLHHLLRSSSFTLYLENDDGTHFPGVRYWIELSPSSRSSSLLIICHRSDALRTLLSVETAHNNGVSRNCSILLIPTVLRDWFKFLSAYPCSSPLCVIDMLHSLQSFDSHRISTPIMALTLLSNKAKNLNYIIFRLPIEPVTILNFYSL